MDDDVVDELDALITAKGMILEPYKRELNDLVKNCENIQNNCISKDREGNQLAGELNHVRESVTFIRRTIDEIQSQQEAIRATNQRMVQRRNYLTDAEKASRSEIVIYSKYFNELKDALSIGADWTPEQQEQRSSLEKERDFLVSKLENKNSQVSGIRSDIDRIYQTIQVYEEEIAKADQDADAIINKTNVLQKEIKNLTQSRIDNDKEMYELRAKVMTEEANLIEKKRIQKSDDSALQSLNVSLEASKVAMEANIKEYDSLYHVLGELNSELERQKKQNIKYEEEIIERSAYVEGREADIEFTNKDIKKTTELRNVCQQKISEIELEKVDYEAKRDLLNKKIHEITSVDIIHVKREVYYN